MAKTAFFTGIYATILLAGYANILVHACQPDSFGPRLETKHLILRNFTLDDTQDLYEVMCDKAVMRFSVSGTRTFEQTQTYIKGLLEHYAKHGFGKLAIVYKASGKVIGVCGLQKTSIDNTDIIELGYRLARRYWNQGLMSEATQAVKEYAFEQLNLPEIVSCIEQENQASIRVAEKNGLIYWKNSEFLGKKCCVYRITKTEYIVANTLK